MADISRRLAAVSDSRGRIVSIFVGAVLLPSIALSVLSFNAVPKQAENLKLSLLRQAEQLLYYVEEDLEQATRRRALEAARAVDPELLLEGRQEAVREALGKAGLAHVSFDSLRLEAWSHTKGPRDSQDRAGAEVRALSAALSGKSSRPAKDDDEEDAVPLTTAGGEELGVVRFRFSCDYAHRQLVQEFFETGFTNPGDAWVIRVSEPSGELLYENASTASGERFEVERVMAAPSFEGVRLQLRYRDRSIEQEVRRLAVAKTALIGFIDVMLLAGLGLVWTNVRRELRLSRLKSDFVANVSHELKTPLALIRLYAETLELARVPNEERKGEYYRVIGKESRRLTQLINNILDFSRIEAGRKEYRLVPSDIGAVRARRGRVVPLRDREARLRADARGAGRPAAARARPRGHRRRRSSTCSTTRSSTAPSRRRSAVRVTARGRPRAARGRATAASASRAPSSAGSSRSSTASRRAWCTPRKAAGSGWHSSSTSPRPTAASSRS